MKTRIITKDFPVNKWILLRLLKLRKQWLPMKRAYWLWMKVIQPATNDLIEYSKMGVRFARWRAVIVIGNGLSGHVCI
jgi:fructose-bisphosphate aldolase class 1